jgi:hypothetical protein
MAIKGGQIIHAGNGVAVIDRIQTAGPGQLNIPTEKIYELGNYNSVATVRDTPDLVFTSESFDVSLEFEALLSGAYTGRTVSDAVTTSADATLTSATAAFVAADVGRQIRIFYNNGTTQVTTILSRTSGVSIELSENATATDTAVEIQIWPNGIDLATAVPVDIASQFKAGVTATSPYAVINSVALPFLYLEQMSYRFGLRDNATQQAQLRGDTIFYNPGPTFVESTAGSGVAAQAIPTAHSAYAVGESDGRRVLAVTVGTSRLTFGVDYTETYGSISGGAAVTTIHLVDAVPTTSTVRLIYSSPTSVSYDATTHPSATVKPAAVRGRDIDVFIGGYDPDDVAGSQANKLTSVQAVTLDWRVTIDKDEEFGNYYAVSQDFDVPSVTGSIDIKPRDPAELMSLIRTLEGISDATKVLGTATSVPLELDIVIKNANDESRVIKRLHVPDARFTPPGFQGRIQQKLTVTVPFESDEGDLLIFSA